MDQRNPQRSPLGLAHSNDLPSVVQAESCRLFTPKRAEILGDSADPADRLGPTEGIQGGTEHHPPVIDVGGLAAPVAQAVEEAGLPVPPLDGLLAAGDMAGVIRTVRRMADVRHQSLTVLPCGWTPYEDLLGIEEVRSIFSEMGMPLEIR